jgi:hypothetical protein
MENSINIEDLPKGQQKYIKEYQRILHGLADIQINIDSLSERATLLTKELTELRAKEKAEFGDSTVLDNV